MSADGYASPRRPILELPSRSASRLIKASHIPLYYQLAVILENRVEAGDYSEGEHFPSEQELCEEFDVSRAVVRPSIAILEREGRVERIKGKGTFVKPPKTTHELGGLARLVSTRQPNSATLAVIEVLNEASPPDAAPLLSPADRAGIRRITAVLRVNDAPIALFWSFISAREASWVNNLVAGPAVRIDDLQSELRLAGGDCIVETSWATDFEASCLEIPGGAPILVALCTEVAQFPTAAELRTVEVAWVICRSDSLRVRARLAAATIDGIGSLPSGASPAKARKRAPGDRRVGPAR